MFYSLTLEPDDNETFLVTCPDLPEVTTFGETVEEAISMGGLAIEEAIARRLSSFGDIPKPTSRTGHRVRVSLQSEAKVRLKWVLDESGLTRADLARLLDWKRPQVDRLFDPMHATRMDQYDLAFQSLNKSPELMVS